MVETPLIRIWFVNANLYFRLPMSFYVEFAINWGKFGTHPLVLPVLHPWKAEDCEVHEAICIHRHERGKLYLGNHEHEGTYANRFVQDCAFLELAQGWHRKTKSPMEGPTRASLSTITSTHSDETGMGGV